MIVWKSNIATNKFSLFSRKYISKEINLPSYGALVEVLSIKHQGQLETRGNAQNFRIIVLYY